MLLLWLLSHSILNLHHHHHHHHHSNHFTSCNAMSGNTAIERLLETEFDLRSPQDFQKKYLSEYLSVRQQGFGSINRYDKRGKYLGTDRIGNWELFAIK